MTSILNHQLICVGLDDIGRSDALSTERAIERGAKLIHAVPMATSVVLQMPRGNLETVHPRALTLNIIKSMIDRYLIKKEYYIRYIIHSLAWETFCQVLNGLQLYVLSIGECLQSIIILFFIDNHRNIDSAHFNEIIFLFSYFLVSHIRKPWRWWKSSGSTWICSTIMTREHFCNTVANS